MTPRLDAVATHAQARPDALACVDLERGERWSYAALDRDADRIGAWLVQTLGPASGERVATVARNSVAMLVLHLACARAGAIFVPLNWRLTTPELAALADDATPAMVFHDAEFNAAGLAERAYDIGAINTLAPAVARPPESARRPSDQPVLLLYTSGTSGRPKGVKISELNIFWGCTNFVLGNGVHPGSVFLCDMPLFHTAGLLAATRVPLLAGATVLISRGFDAERTLARIADLALGITHYFSVPQMANMLWQRPEFRPEMLRRLQVYAMGGAPNPPAQIERFVRAGIAMSDGFGMSETCSNFGMPTDPALLLAKAGSCGLPYVSLETRFIDDDGMDVIEGEAGELWLRGPSISAGYWNQPELTARSFRDGWFMTGDIARRDADGFTFILDRKKDMFISGGENVYPAEIEAVLAELGEIAEAAVVGVPDERWGEVGRAYVIAKAGSGLTEAAITDHCRARLAGFKIPASIVITDSIPRTATGKALKHQLR